MAAGARLAAAPKPPEPGVIMSTTEPAGAWNAPLLGSGGFAIGRGQGDDGSGAGLAAEQPERRRRHALHAQRARRHRRPQQAPGAARAAAAAILSRAPESGFIS